MAVLLENDMFTFWFWILVIGRYAIMFRFGTRFLALTVAVGTKTLHGTERVPQWSHIGSTV